jgi:hypothetical protein
MIPILKQLQHILTTLIFKQPVYENKTFISTNFYFINELFSN